eukprot:3727860-Alexandrium_andersonii.AAC.1
MPSRGMAHSVACHRLASTSPALQGSQRHRSSGRPALVESVATTCAVPQESSPAVDPGEQVVVSILRQGREEPMDPGAPPPPRRK